MNKRTKILLSILAAIVVLAGGWLYLERVNQPQQVSNQQAAEQVEVGDKITFSEGGKQASYTGEEGKTALEVLKSLTEVDTKEYDYGTMVVGINGVKADDGKNYWSFYVNDAYASEGAGTYKTKAADKITWKLEEVKL